MDAHIAGAAAPHLASPLGPSRAGARTAVGVGERCPHGSRAAALALTVAAARSVVAAACAVELPAAGKDRAASRSLAGP